MLLCFVRPISFNKETLIFTLTTLGEKCLKFATEMLPSTSILKDRSLLILSFSASLFFSWTTLNLLSLLASVPLSMAGQYYQLRLLFAISVIGIATASKCCSYNHRRRHHFIKTHFYGIHNLETKSFFSHFFSMLFIKIFIWSNRKQHFENGGKKSMLRQKK